MRRLVGWFQVLAVLFFAVAAAAAVAALRGGRQDVVEARQADVQ